MGGSDQGQSTHQLVAAFVVVQMTQSILSGETPKPLPGFQTDLIQELEGFVRALPDGVAHLWLGRVPAHPEWPEPYFEIIPNNPKAALLKGAAVGTDLDLTVGHSWREFYGFARGGTVGQGATLQEELRWIWLAVIAGRLTERLSLDSHGKVIGWDSKLVVNGNDLVFRNGRRTERLFGRENVKTVIYEPYV